MHDPTGVHRRGLRIHTASSVRQHRKRNRQCNNDYHDSDRTVDYLRNTTDLYTASSICHHLICYSNVLYRHDHDTNLNREYVLDGTIRMVIVLLSTIEKFSYATVDD